MTRDACVDADQAAAYVADALGHAARAALEDHVDTCPDCRRLISEAARETADGSGGYASAGGWPCGTQLGPYVLEAVVDAGAVGVVYAARDARLGRQVALKAVRVDGEVGAARARICSEAVAMARLAHPNVVAVYDVVECAGSHYVAMELVRGGSVRRWLAESRRPWREIVDVFVGAGEGLAAVHAAGLIHRDVKPANLLRGDDGRVRIADFGLAIAADPTRAHAAAGTPAYLAPELRRGASADARSDQYALCASLHEALYGALPGSPPAWPARAPRRVLAAVARGLRDDPALRFPSIRALLDELAAARRPQRIGWLVALALVLAVPACSAASSSSAARWRRTPRTARRCGS